MPYRYLPYRRTLTGRAQSLRRDPTRPERKLWFEFLSGLKQKFTRQKPLGKYIADFYCSEHKLVIELDGDSHFSGRTQVYDRARTEELGLQGVRVVRFSNEDVMQNFEAVCMAIERALETPPSA
jgi:very-short-patch-repair endonuclease